MFPVHVLFFVMRKQYSGLQFGKTKLFGVGDRGVSMLPHMKASSLTLASYEPKLLRT